MTTLCSHMLILTGLFDAEATIAGGGSTGSSFDERWTIRFGRYAAHVYEGACFVASNRFVVGWPVAAPQILKLLENLGNIA